MEVFNKYECMNEIDEKKNRERKRKNKSGKRSRERIIILIKIDEDEKWRNIRIVGSIERDEDKGEILEDKERKGERKEGNNGRLKERKKKKKDSMEKGREKSWRRIIKIEDDLIDDRMKGEKKEGK